MVIVDHDYIPFGCGSVTYKVFVFSYVINEDYEVKFLRLARCLFRHRSPQELGVYWFHEQSPGDPELQ